MLFLRSREEKKAKEDGVFPPFKLRFDLEKKRCTESVCPSGIRSFGSLLPSTFLELSNFGTLFPTLTPFHRLYIHAPSRDEERATLQSRHACPQHGSSILVNSHSPLAKKEESSDHTNSKTIHTMSDLVAGSLLLRRRLTRHERRPSGRVCSHLGSKTSTFPFKYSKCD